MDLPRVVKPAETPRRLAMKVRPVAMSAKATGIPRKNKANRKTSPSTPTATLPMPGSLCVATHHAPSMGRHPRQRARRACRFPARRQASESAFSRSWSRVTASRAKPNDASPMNGVSGIRSTSVTDEVEAAYRAVV